MHYLDFNGLQSYYRLFHEYLNWGPSIDVDDQGIIDLKLAKQFILSPSQDVQLSFIHSPRTAACDIWIKIVDAGHSNVFWPSNVFWGYGEKEPVLVKYGFNVIKLSTIDGGANWIAKNLYKKEYFSDDWPEPTANPVLDLSSALKFYCDASRLSAGASIEFEGEPVSDYFWIRVKDGGNKLTWPDNVEWRGNAEPPVLQSNGDDAILLIKSNTEDKWIAKREYRLIDNTMYIPSSSDNPSNVLSSVTGNYGTEYGVDFYLASTSGLSGSELVCGDHLELDSQNLKSNTPYHICFLDNLIYANYAGISWWVNLQRSHYDGLFIWIEYKDSLGNDHRYSICGNGIPCGWNSEYCTWNEVAHHMMDSIESQWYNSDLDIDNLRFDPLAKYVQVDYSKLEEVGSSIEYYVNYEVEIVNNKVRYIPYNDKNMVVTITHTPDHRLAATFVWRRIEDA